MKAHVSDKSDVLEGTLYQPKDLKEKLMKTNYILSFFTGPRGEEERALMQADVKITTTLASKISFR